MTKGGKPASGTCKTDVMKYLEADVSKLTERKLKSPKYCNGLGDSNDPTCCGTKEFDEIKKKWDACLKRQSDSIYTNFYQQLVIKVGSVEAYAKTVQPTIEVITPKLADNKKKTPSSTNKSKTPASSNSKNVQKKRALSQNYRRLQAPATDKIKVTAEVKASVDKLATTKFDVKTYDSWKTAAAMCLYRQMDLVKGAMCSYCGSENVIRWQDNSKINVSVADIEGWSSACYDYLLVSRDMLILIQDIQNLFQASKTKPKLIPPVNPLPTTAEYTTILDAVKACKEDSVNCKKGEAEISKVFAMNVLPRLDLENFERTKDAVNLILHMKEPTPSPKRRMDDLVMSLHRQSSRRMQKVDPPKPAPKPAPTPSKVPFVSLCMVPYHDIQKDPKGKLSDKANYSPAYTIDINDKLNKSLITFDAKLALPNIGDIPAKINPPKRVSFDLTCKISFKFGMNSTSKVITYTHPSTLCLNTKKYCCERFSVIKLKAKWDDPTAGYKHKISQCEESKLYVTEYMITSLFNFSLKFRKSKKGAPFCRQNEKNNMVCDQLYNYIGQENKKIAKVFPKYIDHYRKCWNYINRLKAAMMCMSCDYERQKYLDIDTKTVHVTKENMEDLVKNCYDMAEFQQTKLVAIYPYYLQWADTVATKVQGIDDSENAEDSGDDQSPSNNKPLRVLQAVKPAKKKEDPNKPPGIPAPKLNKPEYAATALSLWQLYQADCIAAVQATKNKTLDEFFKANKQTPFQETACGKFAQMLSSHVTGLREPDDLYRWRGDMWRKTYNFFFSVGNRFARTKWFSYTNKYCYYNKIKDLEAFNSEKMRFAKKKPKRGLNMKRRLQAPKPKPVDPTPKPVDPTPKPKPVDPTPKPVDPTPGPKPVDPTPGPKPVDPNSEAALTALDTYWTFKEMPVENSVDFQKLYYDSGFTTPQIYASNIMKIGTLFLLFVSIFIS